MMAQPSTPVSRELYCLCLLRISVMIELCFPLKIYNTHCVQSFYIIFI